MKILVQGCRAAGLQGCRAAGLQGCSGANVCQGFRHAVGRFLASRSHRNFGQGLGARLASKEEPLRAAQTAARRDDQTPKVIGLTLKAWLRVLIYLPKKMSYPVLAEEDLSIAVDEEPSFHEIHSLEV